jgi:hypothetical protein
VSDPRHYTLKIDVEVCDQDDAEHFQPDTCFVRSASFPLMPVGTTDAEALAGVFRFQVLGHDMTDEQVWAIVRRAIDEAREQKQQVVK